MSIKYEDFEKDDLLSESMGKMIDVLMLRKLIILKLNILEAENTAIKARLDALELNAIPK